MRIRAFDCDSFGCRLDGALVLPSVGYPEQTQEGLNTEGEAAWDSNNFTPASQAESTACHTATPFQNTRDTGTVMGMRIGDIESAMFRTAIRSRRIAHRHRVQTD